MNARTTTRCLGFLARTALLLGLLLNSTMGWAQLIAGWDFQTATTGGTVAAVAPSSPTVFNANFGSGTIYLNGTNGAGTWVTATTNNEITAFAGTAVNAGAGFSTTTTSPACIALLGGAAGTATNGKFMVLRFSMTGRINLVVSYASQRTTTGYSAQTWEYSTDGTSWTTAQVVSTVGTSFSAITLTTITGLDNAANAYLRFSGTGASAAAGNNRLDNIQLNATVATPTIGTPVPTSLSGFTTTQGTPSSSQTFTITGSNLAANLVCASQSTEFELREQGTPTYSSSVSFTPSSGAVSKTVEVRLTGATVGTPSSSVLISSGTASTQSVALSGTVNANGAPDCLGVIGGTALPGTPCTDSDPCTINEVYLANCTCVGLFNDTDGDGICNANDNCPNQAGQIGSTCNDNDACTTGDVVNSSCVCAGTVDNTDTDGDGVPNCQDGCPLDGSKITPGLCGCGVLEVGNVCDDNNACTINDIYVSCGVCAGTSPSDLWNFGTVLPGTASPTTSNIPNLTGGAVTQNNNFGTNTMLSTTSASNNSGASGAVNIVATCVAGALSTTTSTYFEVSLTPAAGYTFVLNGISFNTRSTGTGPTAYSVRTSANNYATELAGGSITNSPVAWTAKSNTGLSASTGTAAPLVVRIYGYGAVGPTAGAGTWRVDDLTINGCTSLLPLYTLTVARSGAGSGTVTSSPAGINCGADCNEDYVSGTVVDLTATPNAGSVFVSWSGACTGSSCSVTMSPARSVTATFDQDSDGDGIGDATDVCQATAVVTGSPLFNPATCGANPGAYLTFTPVNSVQVRTSVSTCPAGSSCAGGDAPPVVCAAGSFSSTTGASTCASCAASCGSGSVETQACTSTTDRVCDLDADNDGIPDTIDGCQATSAVTGSPLFNAATCGANPGAYLDYSSVGTVQVATAISACPAGSYCTGGTAPSALCPPGHFSDVMGSAVCQSCAAGSFSAVEGSQVCQSCAAGSFSSVTGSTTCTSCGAGTYNPTTGATECLTCSGTTNTPTGATSCTTSFSFTVTNIGGSTSGCVVTSTPAGIDCGTSCSNSFAAGSSVTLHAQASLHHVFVGWSGSCTGTGDCVTTMDSNKSASAQFELDSDDDGIPDATDDCQATATVTSSLLFSAATCGANPGAYLDYSDVSGVQVATAISECPAGSYCTGGTAPSVLCPAGRFSDVTGSAVCQSCAAGFFSSIEGATQCTACDAGKFSNTVGATQCTSCASGTYNPFTGQTECLSCTGGTDATSAATVCLDYPGSPYCPVGTATPTLSGGSGGALYTCSSGQCSSLALNPATGEVDLAASAPGTYQVCASGACVEVVIHPPAELDPPTVSQTGGTNPTCSSSPVEFHATGTYSDGSSYDSDVSYVWSPGGITINGNGFFSVSAPVSGDVSVSVTSSRVCASSTPVVSSNTISLVVTPVLSIDASSLAIEQTVGTPSTCSGSAMEFHLTGLYSDGSSATNDLSATWTDGVITITGQNFGFSADASSSAVSASSVTSARSCVSNSGSVQSPSDFPVSATLSSTLSLVSLDVTSGSNPTCSGISRQLTATATFSDGTSAASRPPGETQYDFYLNGALVQSSSNPLYTDNGLQDNPLFVTVSSSRPCLSGSSSMSSSTVSLQVTAQVAYALDADNDDYFVDGSEVSACSPPSSLHRPVSQLAGGGDCDDSDDTVNPGATEICNGTDPKDDDCDGLVDEGSNVFYRDADGDTYGDVSVTMSVVCTTPPTGFVSNSGDCDDTRSDVHPGGTEVCDGGDVDEDCDGLHNEGDNLFYRDADGDTYGDLSVSVSLVCTTPPPGFVSDATDCDDTRSDVHPGATEVCDGGDVDEDCDGLHNEGDNLFYRDADGDTYGDPLVTVSLVCTSPPTGFVSDGGDCDDTDAARHPGASEVCDGVDQDCDSSVDEGTNLFYRDADGDTYGDVSVSVSLVCTAPPSGFVSNSGDCDDTRNDVHPGATETCDGEDEDCDGQADNADTGAGNAFYRDADGDTYGDVSVSVSLVCTTPPSGFVSDATDCDDTDASVHPNGTETCDSADEDCDGFVDEGSNLFYRDADGDTYGDVSVSVSLVCTAPPSGFVSDATDCDDTDASVHPNGTETCDNADEDCDGFVDEGSNVFYRDFDGDTYGDPLVTVSLVCTSPPSGFVSDGGDCDDTDAARHPGASELCDGADQDCDGAVDEGTNVFFADVDGDTYGDASSTVSLVCTSPPNGFVSNSGDCDDTDASRHPGAGELCDGVDQDCDSFVDEGSNVFYRDADGDSFGDLSVTVSLVCTAPPSGFVSNSGDCDDTRMLYADLDGDGIGAGAPVACGVQTNTDNCPSVQGVIGSPCDDGNTATSNDVLNSGCVCAGSASCLTNPVTLTLTTDANAAQITWYVMLTGTNTAVCSGNGLASSSTIAVDCCLPNGCYDLVITDDFGDGIVGGGYVLRDGTGKRIIDNAGNGGGFTTLSLSPLGFCVPLGADALMAASCDVETATLTTVLRAEPNAAVTAQFGVHNSNSGYQFWVTNPNGGFSRRILFTHAAPGTGAPAGTAASLKASYFLLSAMNSSAPLIPQGILLNVRVRTQVNGVYSNFGPACRLIIPVPPCATTQLTTTASPVVSCGATGLTNSSVIWANAVAGATGYQFEFSKAGYTRRILSSTRSQALSFITSPLQMNNCYQVRVRISYDNSSTYCPFGPYCTITLGTANCGTSGMALEGGDETIMAEEARLSLWPNPNDGSILNISLTEFDATINVVSMDVTDVFGKLVATRTLPVQDGRLNTAVSFEQDLAPGLYLVNLTAGEHRYTERLVIQ